MVFYGLQNSKNVYYCAILLLLLLFSFSLHTKEKAASNNIDENILIFISLDLPDKTLKELYQDAQNSKVPTQLFLAEPYQNCLIKTKQRLRKLGIQVFIHPKWFEKYQDEKLPIFCFFRKKEGLIILHGDMSLAVAKERINQNTGTTY